MFEYHGHLVRFEWQSKQALAASSRVCGESQRGSALRGGFVCERPYGTACASRNNAAPTATTQPSRRQTRLGRRPAGGVEEGRNTSAPDEPVGVLSGSCPGAVVIS